MDTFIDLISLVNLIQDCDCCLVFLCVSLICRILFNSITALYWNGKCSKKYKVITILWNICTFCTLLNCGYQWSYFIFCRIYDYASGRMHFSLLFGAQQLQSSFCEKCV